MGETVQKDVFHPDNGDRSGIDNVLIMISDGRATEDMLRINQVISNFDSSTEIYTVAVGKNYNEKQLKQIASNPDSSYFFTMYDEFDVLSISQDILEQLCI